MHFLRIVHAAAEQSQFVGLTEHRGPIKLQVHGKIPAYAAGALYRTGPATDRIETEHRGTHHVSHWFDGFAHTHRFDIAAPETAGGETTVTYSSRRQTDAFVERIKKKGWRTGITFAQRADPCVGMFAKATSRFDPDAINNNVVVLRNVPGFDKNKPTTTVGHRSVTTDNIVLSTDAAVLQSIDKDTLEPLDSGRMDRFHPGLGGQLALSHAQQDEQTGDLFNVNLKFGPVATYKFFRVSAKTGKTDILATVADPSLSPAYIHSFFMTENYVVLCVPSSHFAWAGIKLPVVGNVLEAIKPFNDKALCKWIVVDRRHGQGVVARFSTPAGFFFHSANAFEETAKDETGKETTYINLDYVHFGSTAPLYAMYYDIILNRDGAADKFWGDQESLEAMAPRFSRRRFAMPSKKQSSSEAAKATAEEVLSIPGPHVGEMPTINPAYAQKPYRYLYSVPTRGLTTAVGDCLAKTDLKTQEALIWAGPKGHTPSEAIFIARPGGADEDDGVLLSVILDGEGKHSYLLCLDAKTMKELGRAEADFAIAFGLHGLHAPAA